MNLTILSQYYPPEIGAAQARLSELAAHLVQRGHQVTVLTAMPSYPHGKLYKGYGGLFKREKVDGVCVIRSFVYPAQRADVGRRLFNYFSFVVSSFLLGSILLPRTDYLLVESPPLFLGFSGWWLSHCKGARLIFNVSDIWPESAARLNLLRRESLAYRLSEKLEAFCYHQAWLVTGQSRSILSSISTRFPECATFHLSNGVDTSRFSPDRQPDSARERLKNGNCLALYAGLHGLAQGLQQVLDTAEALGRDGGVTFVLVGDGPEKRKLIEECQQRKLTEVSFLDSLPAPEIPALLAACDMALVTLKTYIPGAVPSKLYEAMASGKPVILVATGEAADIVQRYRAGITVQPGDINGFVRAVQSLRDDGELRKELGANGRRAAQNHFDRKDIDTRFINHLEAYVHEGVADE
jgi:colanic acid biosynthesis glycosyl transferase WcaI